MIGTGDYMKYRSNLTDQQAQRQTGTEPRESNLPQGEKICTQNEDKNDTK